MREDDAQHRATEFVKELFAAGGIDADHLDTSVARLLASRTETASGRAPAPWSGRPPRSASPRGPRCGGIDPAADPMPVLTGGQGEEQPGHLELESRQIRLAATSHYARLSPEGEISGAHADRTARGKTRSSHRSTSSAPST